MFKTFTFCTVKRLASKVTDRFTTYTYPQCDTVILEMVNGSDSSVNSMAVNYKDIPRLVKNLEKSYNSKCLDNGESPKVIF